MLEKVLFDIEKKGHFIYFMKSVRLLIRKDVEVTEFCENEKLVRVRVRTFKTTHTHKTREQKVLTSGHEGTAPELSNNRCSNHQTTVRRKFKQVNKKVLLEEPLRKVTHREFRGERGWLGHSIFTTKSFNVLPMRY